MSELSSANSADGTALIFNGENRRAPPPLKARGENGMFRRAPDAAMRRTVTTTQPIEARLLIARLDEELRNTRAQLGATRRAYEAMKALISDAASGLERTATAARRDFSGRPVRFVDQVAHSRKSDSREEMPHHARPDESTFTLRKRLADRAVQVRHLTSELIHAEQAERERIAHVLHDDLQQLLYAFQIRVSTLTRDLPEEHAERLTQASTLIGRALEVTRNLTVELSPPVLKEDDITDAVAWLGLRMEELHGLKVQVTASGPIHLPADARTLVYQLLGELLFNVVKHAGVDAARVQLRRDEDRCVLTVSDDGVGFDPAAQKERDPSSGGGFGLWSMQQRLTYLGGRLERESSPGKGACVRVLVPIGPGASGPETDTMYDEPEHGRGR